MLGQGACCAMSDSCRPGMAAPAECRRPMVRAAGLLYNETWPGLAMLRLQAAQFCWLPA